MSESKLARSTRRNENQTKEKKLLELYLRTFTTAKSTRTHKYNMQSTSQTPIRKSEFYFSVFSFTVCAYVEELIYFNRPSLTMYIKHNERIPFSANKNVSIINYHLKINAKKSIYERNVKI